MKKKMSLMFIITGILIMLSGVVTGFAQDAGTTTEETTVETEAPTDGGIGWGLALGILGAAISTFGGGFGSSVGVGIAGEVGDGVLSEDEKKFGPVLLLQALPMTQGIYGMLIAFIILPKLALDLSVTDGFGILFAALPIAVTALISGIWQGKVSAASIQLIARKPKQLGQAVVLPAMVETFAVFGLLISVIMLGQI